MTSRSPLIALLILLALPATGHASNPLLSGYGGPGGGEQVMLGGGTVGGGASTSGGSGQAADESLRATAPSSAAAPSASSTLTAAPQKRKSQSSSASHSKTMSSGSTTTTTPTTSAGTPQAVAYPTRAGEVSGLPISAAGILALVAAIAIFVLAALGLRRLSVGSEDAPRRPQVSSS
jgi:hypothetical protein